MESKFLKKDEEMTLSQGAFMILSDLWIYFLIGFSWGFWIASAIYLLFF